MTIELQKLFGDLVKWNALQKDQHWRHTLEQNFELTSVLHSIHSQKMPYVYRINLT